jgi:hypothetical protein
MTHELFLIKKIQKLRSKKDLGNIIWKSFLGYKPIINQTKNLRILILNAPCNGFGDLIFALKFSNYLEKWYKAKITLATTYIKGLKQLIKNKKTSIRILELTAEGGMKGNLKCKLFKNIKFKQKIPKQDLIFVAPLAMDEEVSLKDVKHVTPYATIFNTFWLSEYNDTNKYAINTGVGGHRDGIFITKIPSVEKKSPIKNPYVLIYISFQEPMTKCLLSFLELIGKKYYKKYKNLDVVIPVSLVDEDIDSKIEKILSKYYPNIYIKTKKETFIITESNNKKKTNKLTFRCDILPVSNIKMISLMKHSLKDILVTGDQSISDVLSCCSSKNIYYQQMSWKKNLANNLARELPNKYLLSTQTSCGTIKALKYNSNYTAFLKKWDFRKLGKPKINAIVLSAIALKNNKEIKIIADLALHSRTITSLKKKIKLLLS